MNQLELVKRNTIYVTLMKEKRMLNLLRRKSLILMVPAVVVWGLAGCSSNGLTHDYTGDSFSNSYYSSYPNSFIYLSPNNDGLVSRVDFETMQNLPLCNKPNCRHTSDDCILNRLRHKVPVFAGSSAYYFVDEEQEVLQGDDGKPELKLGSSLYCYDMKKGKETKLFSLPDVSVSKNCYGLLLHDQVLYFITNSLSRYYDENGVMYGYGGTGGDMHLYAYYFADGSAKDLGRLYDVPKIKEYYPDVVRSGEVYMKGLFDNKIYFNVGFVAGEEKRYRFYVTYYDLTDGTYHGTPEDYEHIDFAAVNYLSDDYLLICRTGEGSVYKKGVEEPVVLEDAYFHQDFFPTVWDNTVFCGDKAFDLNSKTVREYAYMKDKAVVARYGDSYIVSDYGMQSDFEKIPAEKLLN